MQLQLEINKKLLPKLATSQSFNTKNIKFGLGLYQNPPIIYSHQLLNKAYSTSAQNNILLAFCSIYTLTALHIHSFSLA